jgi:hypothetical protein
MNEETRKKISKSRKGFKMSNEQKIKLSVAHTGKKFSIETRKKMSTAQRGLKKPHKHSMSEENKKIHSLAALNGNMARGKNHYRWVENLSNYDRIRCSGKYRQWRKNVLHRDNNTCTKCGVTEVPLQVHHIIPFVDKIDTVFDIGNGQTLCRPCHIKTDNYGFKTYNYRKQLV